MYEMNQDEYLAKNASKLTEVNPNQPQKTVSEVAISRSEPLHDRQ